MKAASDTVHILYLILNGYFVLMNQYPKLFPLYCLFVAYADRQNCLLIKLLIFMIQEAPISEQCSHLHRG